MIYSRYRELVRLGVPAAVAEAEACPQFWWVPIAAALAQGAGGGLTAKPSTPQSIVSEPLTNSWFDGSGWTVATGGSKAAGGDRDQSQGMEPSPLMIGALLLAGVAWIVFKK